MEKGEERVEETHQVDFLHRLINSAFHRGRNGEL